MVGFNEEQMAQLENLLSPIISRLTSIEERMTSIIKRMTSIETNSSITYVLYSCFETIKIYYKRNVLIYNSTLGRIDQLKEVPRASDGLCPCEMDLRTESSLSLDNLLVACNITLPSSGSNILNKRKSLTLFTFYCEDEHSSTEDEQMEKSRVKHVKIC